MPKEPCPRIHSEPSAWRQMSTWVASMARLSSPCSSLSAELPVDTLDVPAPLTGLSCCWGAVLGEPS